MSNTMKSRWRSGEVAYGAWMALPDTASAEIVARAGYDYCCIDMQHGYADYRTMVMMLQAINIGSSSPTVRVPWNEPGIIGRVLDAGAMNLIVPMVNSVEEARAAVSACKYPPLGARSHGPIRAAMQEGHGYVATANDEVACIPMIETKAAIEALDEILTIPGIDAVYVGPSDLAISYGLPVATADEDDEYNAALTKVVASCVERGITPGIHSSPRQVQLRVEQGFKMITVTSDSAALGAAIAAELRNVRTIEPPKEAPQSLY